jgi:3-isopropylmalate/(R)-2-methylmalate dehydratase large subunit
MTQTQTLYDRLMNAHVVREEQNTALIYIDRQLIHEVTSPQAFEGLAMAGRKPWRIQANLAVPDHNVPTTSNKKNDMRKILGFSKDSPMLKSNLPGGRDNIEDPISRLQVETLSVNCKKFHIEEIPLNDIRQGIVHVVGPEQGATLPGMSIVCGDSHTSTHGALGALAFGIGLVFCTSSLALFGFGTLSSMATTISGEVPQVTWGLISLALKLNVLSKCAPSSERSVFQYLTALSHSRQTC